MDVLTEFYSPEEIIQTPLEELVFLVAKAEKNRSPHPKKIATEIKKAAKESYRLRPNLADSVQPGAACLMVYSTSLSTSFMELLTKVSQSTPPNKQILSTTIYISKYLLSLSKIFIF